MILLGVCIVLILLVVHVLLYNLYDAKYNKLKTIDHDELRAGDILLMKYCEVCKNKDNVLDVLWQYTIKKTLNSLKAHSTGYHTHTAIVLNVDSKPRITHIDKGTMYDVITEDRQKGKVNASPMEHLDRRGGVVYAYRFKGELPDSTSWVKSNASITYPQGIDIALVNGFKLKKNPIGVMACTDYVENTLDYYNLLGYEPSSCATLNDIVKLVKTNPNYCHIPVVVKNKCYMEQHYT